LAPDTVGLGGMQRQPERPSPAETGKNQTRCHTTGQGNTPVLN
jgi:hypothetical protein